MSDRTSRAISLTALALLVLGLIFPDRVSWVTIALLVIAGLPWLHIVLRNLGSSMQSLELPGGVKIAFRDAEAAGEKILTGTAVSATAIPSPKPSYLSIAEKDPNLALVGLRIEIEKRLRVLAESCDIREERSLSRLIHSLADIGALTPQVASGLNELTIIGNKAAHGADVEPRVSEWAINVGPEILAALDGLLTKDTETAAATH